MNKEMKKNNKMFLALVVVAALAMVSIAGIALSEKSDAATTSAEMKAGNSIIVDGTSTENYNFFVEEGNFFGAIPFVVAANSSYSGTLSIGIRAADGTYTVYSQMALANAKDVSITAIAYNTSAGVVSFFMIGNSSVDPADMPAGTYELKKGQVMLGSVTNNVPTLDWETLYVAPATAAAIDTFLTDQAQNKNAVPFNGTIVAGDFTVASAYVFGAVVSLDSGGKARLSGFAASPTEVLTQDGNGDYPKATLSLKGEASIQFPESFQAVRDAGVGIDVTIGGGLWSFIDLDTFGGAPDMFKTDSVAVTVEEGAVITAGSIVPTISQDVTVKTGDNVIFAWLIGSDGKAISATAASLGSPDAIFSGVAFGNYTLVMGTGAPGSVNVYRGTVTVSATGAAVAANNLPAATTFPGGTVDFTINGDDNLEYDPSLYNFLYAFNAGIGKGEVGTLGKVISSTARVVEFKGVVAPGDEIFAIMSHRTNGTIYAWYGVAAGTDSAVAPLISVVTTATLGAGEILNKGDVTIAPSRAVYQVLDKSVITVKGKMDFLYIDANNMGELDLGTGGTGGDLDFSGAGIVSHGTGIIPATGAGIIELPLVFNSDNLSTAYYFVNEGTGATAKATYYFTSLSNAITNSNTVYLVGDVVILEDTTLSNSGGNLTVILTPSSTLSVGKDDSDGTDAVSAILTIPSGTDLLISDPGSYKVVNGQAVYDVKPALADEPISDIMIAGSKFIYTDLATALDNAQSGDVLELLQNATLNRDAAVKAGVELKDSPTGALTIPADKILTVNGTLTSKNAIFIDGTLRVNNLANFDGSSITFGTSGVIDVTASGTLNFNNTTTTGANGSIIVSGKADVKGSLTNITVSELTVTGTITVASASSLAVADILTVGKQPTLSTDVSNTAVINGVINLNGTAYAVVYGTMSMSGKLAPTPIYSTKYVIGNSTYLTLYATVTNKDLVMFRETQLLDIIIKDWYYNAMFTGTSLQTLIDGGTPPSIGDAGPPINWTTVYADFEYKKYDVTLAYAQGVTWTLNGVEASGVKQVNYGSSITVTAVVNPGYEGSPSIRADGAAYGGGPFTVTKNVTFSVTGVSQIGSGNNGGGGGNGERTYGGLTLIEILLIIIVIIIAIIAIIIAIRLLRS